MHRRERSKGVNEKNGARTGGVVVRDAAEADMEAVARIYAHHVEHGGDLRGGSPERRRDARPPAEGAGGRRALSRGRNRRRSRRLLLRRALSCAAGLSAYAGGQRLCRAGPRGTRRWRRAARRTDRALRGRPMAWIVAIIGDSGNSASIALHRRHGFAPVGTLRSIGFKFGRWVDTPIMQRALGAGDLRRPTILRRRRRADADHRSERRQLVVAAEFGGIERRPAHAPPVTVLKKGVVAG